MKDKYPCGTVGQNERDDVLAELEELFGSLEVDGRKAIKNMYRKENIYSGLWLENAPDLVLVATKGFNLKAKVNSQTLAEKGIFTGKHTQDTAFLVAKSIVEEITVPAQPFVSCIKSIVEVGSNIRRYLARS